MMKKIGLLLIFMGFLQSCTINSEFVFHKDNTITSTLEIEVNEEAQPTTQSESELPVQWTSMYDLYKAKRSEPIDEESIDFIKRTFTKGIFRNGEEVGFGIRFERMTQQEWDKLGESHKPEEKMLFSLKKSSMDWDGKKLTIDLEELMKKGENNFVEEPKVEEDQEFGEKIVEILDIEVNVVFRFENKVKSVVGKHPNFKKIDEHSFQFSMNTKDEMKQSNKKKKYDKKIVIITE